MTETEKKEYKDTLNLPKTTLDMRANATKKEPETQKFWEEQDIYNKMNENKDKSNSFILHDGPPYLSSEKIHVGTALNKILKDILIKYKSQRGYYAPFVPGYDGHGLPIENKVVKNIEGGRDALTPAQLREKCREFAHASLKGQESEFKRLGVLGNWENPYLTINPEYEAEQVRVFGEMYKKGYIEKGLKPVYWCASCETALAEAEVEYADHTSDSIYVRFKFDEESVSKLHEKFDFLKSESNIYSVIWTTTPWTIPSNLAISVHPKFEYTFFKYNSDVYYAATGLLGMFLNGVKWEEQDIVVLGTCKGEDLEGLTPNHPLYERKSPILCGEHVTLEAGTGSVHTAPGHGLEDYEVCCKYKIDVYSPLDSKGIWTKEAGDLEGIPYYKGNESDIPWNPGDITRSTSKNNSTMPVRLLGKMYEYTKDSKYLNAIKKAGDFIYTHLYPQHKYYGGTCDNPDSMDKEAGVYAMYAYDTLYTLTKDPKWLDCLKQATIFTMSSVLTLSYKIPDSASDLKAAYSLECGYTDGLSYICCNGTSLDNYAAYIYYQLFRLYIHSGEKVYYDMAEFIQQNTKSTMDWDGKLNYAYKSLTPEASTIYSFGYHSATDDDDVMGVWLPWQSAANAEPIAKMYDTFNEADVKAFEKTPITTLQETLAKFGVGGNAHRKY